MAPRGPDHPQVIHGCCGYGPDPTAEPVDLLPVEVEDEAQVEGAEFLLLERGGDPDAPVPTMVEESAEAAMELWLLPDLAAATPYPPLSAGGARERAPEAWLCVTRQGRRYLVQRSEGFDLERMTQGELWRTYSPRELRRFHWAWERLLRPPSASPRTPSRG